MALLGEFWSQYNVDGHPWVILGDFNDLPLDGVIGQFLQAQGGILAGDPTVPSPTRWKGSRCVDWAMARASPELHLESNGLENALAISDHIGLHFKFSCLRITSMGRLPCHVNWSKPEHIASDKWVEFLDLAWQNDVIPSDAFTRLADNLAKGLEQQCLSDVQTMWDDFLACLVYCFKLTLHRLAAQTSNPELAHEANLKLRRGTGKHKGQWAQPQQVTIGGATRVTQGRLSPDCEGNWLGPMKLAAIF